jgi:hypothetical protein
VVIIIEPTPTGAVAPENRFRVTRNCARAKLASWLGALAYGDGQWAVYLEVLERIELRKAFRHDGGNKSPERGCKSRRKKDAIVDHAILEERTWVSKREGNASVAYVMRD